MKDKLILTAIPIDDLQTMIIDCVNTCLKHYTFNEPNPEEPQQLLSKKQAAHLWGCSTSTIDNYARRGVLTRHYIGSSVRFKRSEVLQVIEEMNKG